MKLKILVKLIEKILGATYQDDQPRADMYLPERLLAMALVMLGGGSACVIWSILSPGPYAIVFAVLGICVGIAMLLCWKNQTIHVISDEQFTYTTMFGKTFTCNFCDIQGLRKNQDSMTLFVAGSKVHIVSMAILSERLVNLINHALKQLQ